MFSRYPLSAGTPAWSASAGLRAAALVCLPLLTAGSAYAQNVITGRVTDAANGDELPGANVTIVQVPNRGAATDLDGNYRITGLPAGTYTVRAAFVGYRTQERSVTLSGSPVNVDFALAEGEITLADYEVSATGFGVQAKTDQTTAATVVAGETINRLPIQSADAALQGRAAGVQVTSYSGAPGGGLTVNVRGVSSIGAGTEPLYLVDGVRIRAGRTAGNASNALAGLNPADIESIEVLKDAAAVSIYGADGANGVVLITTKRGRGRDTAPLVTISSQFGTRQRIKEFETLTGAEFIESQIEAAVNATRLRGVVAGGVARAATQADLDQVRADVIASLGDPATAQTYDWQNAVYRTGVTRRVDASVEGAAGAVNYFLSGGYNSEQGQVLNSDFGRYSFVSNVDVKPSRFLTTSLNLRLSRFNGDRTTADGNWINGPFFQGVRQRPIDPIYVDEAAGLYNEGVRGGINILQNQLLREVNYKINTISGSVNSTWQIRPDLVARALVGADVQNIDQYTFNTPDLPSYRTSGGSVFNSNEESVDFNGNTTLNYFKTFNRLHNVSLLGGAEYKSQELVYFSAQGNVVPNGLFGTLSATATPQQPTSSDTRFRQAGIFSQAKYDYASRYFLSASLRRDGSSRFGANNRYGTFYSVSAAWDAAKESFLQNDWLDLLRFRVSQGTSGNSSIGNFDSRTLIGLGGNYQGIPGIRLSQIGDPDLTWERADQYDIGLDFGFFGNRVSGAVDYYNKTSRDLLLGRSLPGDAGITSVRQNLGSLRNQGVEFELTTVNVLRPNFEWRTTFNIARNTNELLSSIDDTTTRTIASNTLLIKGQPISIYEGYRSAGVNPATGRLMWYDRNGNLTYQPAELDGRNVLGSTIPTAYGGLGNTITAFGVTLDAFFQFNYGQKTFQQQIGYFLRDPSRGDNLLRDVLDRWQQPGDLTDTPIFYNSSTVPLTGSLYTQDDRYVVDASYIRLKTLTLSYTIPQTYLRWAGARGLDVFLQGQNLLTWTNYDGVDPELVGSNAAPYPQAKVYTLGLTARF